MCACVCVWKAMRKATVNDNCFPSVMYRHLYKYLEMFKILPPLPSTLPPFLSPVPPSSLSLSSSSLLLPLLSHPFLTITKADSTFKPIDPTVMATFEQVTFTSCRPSPWLPSSCMLRKRGVVWTFKSTRVPRPSYPKPRKVPTGASLQ